MCCCSPFLMSPRAPTAAGIVSVSILIVSICGEFSSGPYLGVSV